MDQETEVVEARLPNDLVVGVEVPRDGAGNVGALDQLDFAQVEGAIEGLAQVVGQALRRVEPQKATAELGLSLKVEAGKLTGVLVQAGGSASIKVSLTWERPVAGAVAAAAAEAASNVEPADAAAPA